MEPWLLEGIKALGVAGGPVFAFLYWLERGERRESQKEVKQLIVQVLTAINSAATSTDTVTATVRALGEGSKEADVQLVALIQSLRPVAGK